MRDKEFTSVLFGYATLVSVNKSIQRKVLLIVFIPLPLLGLVCALLFWQLSRWQQETKWVEHSSDVLAQSHLALRYLIDQETGVRGYLLTRTPAFLEPFESGKTGFSKAIEALETSVSDDPAQESTIRSLQTKYKSWQQQVAVALSGSTPKATALVDDALSRKSQMDSIRQDFSTIVDREQDKLHNYRGSSEGSFSFVRKTFPVWFLAAALVLVWLIRKLTREIDAVYQSALAERDRSLVVEKQARAAAEALAEEVTERSQEMEKVVSQLRSERDDARRRLTGLGEAHS